MIEHEDIDWRFTTQPMEAVGECPGCDGKGRRMDMSLIGWPSVDCTDCGGTGTTSRSAKARRGAELITVFASGYKIKGRRDLLGRLNELPLELWIGVGRCGGPQVLDRMTVWQQVCWILNYTGRMHKNYTLNSLWETDGVLVVRLNTTTEEL